MTTAKNHVLTTAAARDIRMIAYYIRDREGGRVAARVTARIRKAFEFLGEHPGAGHVREDLGDPDLRCWNLWSYLVVYDASSDPIHIIRVLHGARDIGPGMPER